MQVWFTASDGLVARSIRAIEGGAANHVGIRYQDDLMVEAVMGHGVRTVSTTHFLDGSRVIAKYDFAVPDEDSVQYFLREQIGKPYDWTGVAGFLPGRDWSATGAWLCSELAIAAAIAGGKRLADRHSRIGVRWSMELIKAWTNALPLPSPAPVPRPRPRVRGLT